VAVIYLSSQAASDTCPTHYPPGAPIHECAGQVVESSSDQYRPGDWVIGIPDGDQGLAESFVAQAAKAVRLPSDLVSCDASCLIQPLSTVMHAVDRLGNIQGQSVTVVGLGSIGFLFFLVAEKAWGRTYCWH
jgi:threonine dehydrogenase-like Zn-dependent dehydrogenase